MVQWNLDDLTLGVSVDGLIEELVRAVAAFTERKDELTDDLSPERFLELIEEYEAIEDRSSVITGYLSLKASEDMHDEEILAVRSKWGQIATALGNDLLFFTHWFTFVEDDLADRFIESKVLEEYRYFLERLRAFKPYTLEEKQERIIALKSAGSSASAFYSVLRSGMSFSFDGEDITEEELKSRIHDHDPDVRKRAYAALFSPFEMNRTILTEIYKGVVLDWHNEEIAIRSFPDAMSVRNLSNDVSESSVAALIEAVERNEHRMQRYYALKRSINGDEYPHSRYHLYAPYRNQPSRSYSYEEARDLVLDVFGSFDHRFEKLAAEVFDANHVHALPKKRKRTGAFSYSVTTRTEPYVMLNHAGKLQDVFTMAHEFGHAVHGQLERNNPELVSHAGLPLSETASLFAELLLTERFLKDSTSDDERIAVLVEQLDGFYASVIRQVGFVRFERYAHEHIPKGASLKQLDQAYARILSSQFGDLQLPESFHGEWSMIPHIHSRPFYVYSYAWGNLLVLSLFEQYRQQGDTFIERYLGLLEAGGTRSPMELLTTFGVDVDSLSFWERGFDLIDKQIDALEKLTNARRDS
jgi:oligoendopeptidase F